MQKIQLTATCGFGLEAVVGRELMQLGYTEQTKTDGRVTFQADMDAIARCNIQLRTANRLLWNVAEFSAEDFDTFFDQIQAIAWEEIIEPGATIPVTGSSQKSTLHGVPTLQGMAKKAIVTRLTGKKGGTLEESGPEVPVHFDFRNNECVVSVNTSGAGLHRRGYRQLAGEAPLRETMAAALVQLSVWKRDRTFLDPMCGSGTIAIEAAMIGRGIAPGLSRNFAGEKWSSIPREFWQQAREEARALQDLSEMEPILATDRDFRVLKVARENARLAGVADCIHFQEQDLADVRTSRKYGCLITNPPYGKRLNEIEEAQNVWRTLAQITRDWSTWSIFVLVGSREFERIFGRRATRRRKLFNGSLECTYYQFLGDKPPRMQHRSQAAGEEASDETTEQD